VARLARGLVFGVTWKENKQEGKMTLRKRIERWEKELVL
jgi:hypothetical protein